jgi:tight adherence protein B
MNLPVILIIAGAFLAFGLLVILLGGPSAGKAKTRRLAMVKDRHAASTEAVVAAQMRKTIQAGGAGAGSSLASLMPRREEMEKRLRRTGKGWTLTQYMFASMALFVVVTGGMLVIRAPFMMAAMIGLFISLGLPYLVVGRAIKKRVTAFNARFPDAIDLLVRGLRSGLPVTETFQVVSQELPGPVGEEFKGVV